MQETQPDFIRTIIQQVERLESGAQLLSLLATYNVSVKSVDDYKGGMTESSDIAFLHLDEGVNTLYLSPGCNGDDMVHELTHLHHIFGLDQDYVSPQDLKHRYITKAMREADAFARQMGAFVDLLEDPDIMEREKEVFETAQLLSQHPDEDVDFYAGACKLFLYTVMNTPPDELLRLIAEEEISKNDLMLDIFCAVLHDYVPTQYEEFHLDQLNDELNKRYEEGDIINYRQAPCAFHSKDDALFFAECLREYGSWGRTDNYLLSPEGYGPDPSVFLNALFSKNVTESIDEMNAELIRPAAPQILPPHIPEF
jgi:hypothetical protein